MRSFHEAGHSKSVSSIRSYWDEDPSCLLSRPPHRLSVPPLAAWVEANVPYLADLSVKPVTYNPPIGTGVARREGNYRDFKMRIHNARPLLGDLSLDRQAFILAPHETQVRDFYDKDEVRRIYEPEVEALIKRQTGASKVVVFDHTIRAADRGVERGHRAPVRCGAQRLHREVGPAARARPAAARRGRGAAEEALRRDQRVAQHRPRSGRDVAAGLRRFREHRAARPCGLRPGLCRPHRRDLYRRLQRRPPLVLLPAHDPRGGRADQVLRLDEGRPRPLLAALGVRRSDLAQESQAAREHRDRTFAFFD